MGAALRLTPAALEGRASFLYRTSCHQLNPYEPLQNPIVQALCLQMGGGGLPRFNIDHVSPWAAARIMSLCRQILQSPAFIAMLSKGSGVKLVDVVPDFFHPQWHHC